MEIPVSTSNRDAQSSSSPGKTDERSFIASLNCFMKDRGTPIERIPHLGFKQSESMLKAYGHHPSSFISLHRIIIFKISLELHVYIMQKFNIKILFVNDKNNCMSQ